VLLAYESLSCFFHRPTRLLDLKTERYICSLSLLLIASGMQQVHHVIAFYFFVFSYYNFKLIVVKCDYVTTYTVYCTLYKIAENKTDLALLIGQ